MLKKGKVLIVDDDAAVRESLAEWFSGEGYQALAAGTAQQALEIAQKERWDVALVDLKLPDVDGLELQANLRSLDPDLPIIVVTAHASVDTAVRTLKSGAHDYIVKPFDPDELVRLVDKTLENCRIKREVARLRENLQAVTETGELVGESPAMKRVGELVETAAPTDATVLITGERGTGKELLARTLHGRSSRRYMPLVVIHCGALIESVAESELFGHEQGAFANARYRRKGKLEVGDGGTVFFDEVGELDPRVQAEVLRVIEDRQLVRLGGDRRVNVDFRCIAASTRRLDELVASGAFRGDLYYRLNVLSIELPPLRQRKEDVPLLADHFLRKYATIMNRQAPEVSKTAMELLLAYDWPGNVRELENAIERAMLIGHDEQIQPSDFPFQSEPRRGDGSLSLAEVERCHIERVVAESNWNLSKSARILEIDRTTLYNKLKRYGLR